MLSLHTIPPSDMHAISVVPPPMSMTMCPSGAFHVEAGTECGRHRFVYHVHLAAAGVFGRFADGTYLYVGRTRRDTNHHPQRRAEEVAAHLDLLSCPTHQFGRIEIGYHSVFERSDSPYVLVCLAVHLLGLLADGYHLAGVCPWR